MDATRRAARRRQLGLGPAPRKLEDAVRQYLEHRRHTVVRNTWGSDRTALLHLVAQVGPDIPTDRIECEQLQELFDALGRRGYEATTLHTYWKSLVSFFRWMGDYDPWRGVRLPKPARTEVRVWSNGEIELLRDAAEYVDSDVREKTWPSARLMLELLLATGARQQELFALEWGRLRERDRTVRIVHQLDRDSGRQLPLKGKLARTTLVLPDLWPHLDRAHRDWRLRLGLILARPDGGPVRYRPQRNLLHALLHAARIRELGMGYHAGRHTYARRFIESGGRLEELQKSLGHRSIRTTEEDYGHFHEDVAARLARSRIYGE